MKRLGLSWRNFLFFLLYICLSAYALLQVYLLGPNTYEQGIMYTAAIAYRDGLLPNRDFFMQYGPIASVIQGTWLRIFGPAVIQLQLATIFSLLALTVLTFIILKKYINQFYALSFVLLWLMTGPHGAPWSSIWSNFFAILGVSILKYSSSSWNKNTTFYRNVHLYFANVSLWLGVLTRLHILLVMVLVIVWVLMNSYLSKEFKSRFFISFFTTAMFMIIVLSLLGILGSWIRQCILWSADNYIGKGPGISLARVGDALFIIIVPLLLFVFFYISSLFYKNGMLKSLFLLVSMGISFLIGIYTFQFREKTAPFTLRNPEILAITLSQKFFFFFSFSVLVVYLSILFLKFLQFIRLKKIAISLFDVVAVALLSQLYPLHDPYHIFVIVPALMIAILETIRSDINYRSFISRVVEYRRFLPSILKILLVILLVENLTLGLKFDYIFREGVLKGLHSRSYYSYIQEGRMSTTWAKSIEQAIKDLDQVSVAQDVHFYCKEGFYSAANGHYLPADPFYVDWGPIPQVRKRVQYSYYCGITKSKLQQLVDSGMTIIKATEFPSSPLYNSGILYYVLMKKV